MNTYFFPPPLNIRESPWNSNEVLSVPFPSLHCGDFISLKGSRVGNKIFLLRYQLLRSMIFLPSCFGLGRFCLFSDISEPISVDAKTWNSQRLAHFCYKMPQLQREFAEYGAQDQDIWNQTEFPEIFSAAWRLLGCRVWMSALPLG